MERSRDRLLLALYALPAPPDGMLINRRACAAANEQDEGSAESRALEGPPAVDAARANFRMDPVGRKRRATSGAAWDDGGAPQRVPDNYSLDATRKGRRADMAGERFLKKHRSGQDAEKEGGAHGRFLLHCQDHCLADPVKKHGGGERFLGEANCAPCSRGVSTTAGERFLGAVNGAPCSRGVSNTAGRRFLGAVNGAPCSRGVSTTAGERSVEKRKYRDYNRDPSRGSRHSDHGEPVTRNGCGLEAAGTGSLNAGSANATSQVWPDSHSSLGHGVGGHSSMANPGAGAAASYYDPVPELLLCSGEVLSKPWQRIWQHTPLVLHDKQLVRCLVSLGAASSGVVLNLTEQITNILEKHPGNVSYFRLDSTSWTGGRTKLSEWMKMLSRKNASEIILVNREDCTSFDFPLQDMQSLCLRSLRLAFFSLPELDLNCFDYSNLTTLELIGCLFQTSKLYYVVKDCNNLTHLGIGLTIKDVKVSSQSLEHIQIWKCNMKYLSIESAPRLQKLISGIYPMWKKQPVLVMIRDTPGLQEFRNLLLPIHKVEDKLWMRSLNKISLGIQMANRSQRELLCDYLQHTPSLQELDIWRMDEVVLLEALDVAVDDSLIKMNAELQCFYSLQTFEMSGFRGGGAEISVISAILRHAMCLVEVRIKPCPTSDKQSIVDAFLALRSTKKVSTECSFKFADPD